MRGGDRWYELSHDRFIQPILRANNAWRTRVQGAETAAVRHREEEVALRAEEQARQSRKLRLLAWTLLGSMLLLVVLGAIAFVLWERARVRDREHVSTSVASKDVALALTYGTAHILPQGVSPSM